MTLNSDVGYIGKEKRNPKIKGGPIVGEETDGISSPSVERNTKGDVLQQNSGKSVAINDVTADEVLRLLGESFPSGVDAVISIFHEWLACLSESEQAEARKDLRLLVLCAFRKMWFSPPVSDLKGMFVSDYLQYDRWSRIRRRSISDFYRAKITICL